MRKPAYATIALTLVYCMFNGQAFAQQEKSQAEMKPQAEMRMMRAPDLPRLKKLDASAIAAATPAAKETLPQLQPLVNEQTFRNLGFDKPEQFREATLGSPLHTFMVRLDDLKKYNARKKVDTLLSETNEVIFPVEVAGKVRTGLKMRLVEGQWRFSSFGASTRTIALSAASRSAMAHSKGKAKEQFEVSVPVFHLHFIAHRNGKGALMLTPASDDSRFKLKAGRTAPAQLVFRRIAAYARTYKTGPRLVE